MIPQKIISDGRVWLVLLCLTNLAMSSGGGVFELIQGNIESLSEHMMQLKDLVQNTSETTKNQLEAKITDMESLIKMMNKTMESFYEQQNKTDENTLRIKNYTCGADDWIVIQQRLDASVDFNRSWSEYRDGFGQVDSASAGFWWGNEKLHQLTSSGNWELLIEMNDGRSGTYRFARYDEFEIADETDKYRLKKLAGYSGTAGDVNNHIAGFIPVGNMFSTYDNDNDKTSHNCAVAYGGGWWWNRCGFGPNSKWNSTAWREGTCEQLSYTRMSVRKKL